MVSNQMTRLIALENFIKVAEYVGSWFPSQDSNSRSSEHKTEMLRAVSPINIKGGFPK